MKKLILTLLILLLSTASEVFAVELSDVYIQDEIRKQIVKQYSKYTDAELDVSIANMPFSKIYIPDGTIKIIVKSNFDKFVPRDIKRIYIYSNGKLEKEFIVNVRTLAYKNVLCAKTTIERDSLLSNANVIPQRMEVSANLDYILTYDMIQNKQMITKKWFREGEILDKRFVKAKPDVEKFTPVQAYFQSNGVMITIDATAVEDGMIGDFITIKNQNYKKSYRGKVIGQNKVLITI